jgi:NAD(P)H-flavin reductase
VTLFFGARRTNELYDMGALHRLAAVNRWLTVVPVVSDDPSFNGERGLLPDAVARAGSWTDHDSRRLRLPGHDPGDGEPADRDRRAG